MSRITKYIEAESRLVDTKEWEEEGVGSDCLGLWGFIMG